MLREVPTFEQPREKALKYGIKSLSNSELLAIILRTGTKDKNVLKLSHDLLNNLSSLHDLLEISIPELTAFNGIGITKAITLLASIELGNRIVSESNNTKIIINAEDVYNTMKSKVQGLKEEVLYGIYLNSKSKIVAIKELTKGNLNSTIIDGKLVFKWAYKLSTPAIILVHNHPSGDPHPSIQDLKYTEIIIKQASIAGFVILDHIIIGTDYYSMKKNEKFFKMF
ncbi:MAG: DNA repair protein RadC [Bacilli bacterium]